MTIVHSILRQNAEIAFQKTQLPTIAHGRIIDEYEENIKNRIEKSARLKAQRLALTATTMTSKAKTAK